MGTTLLDRLRRLRDAWNGWLDDATAVPPPVPELRGYPVAGRAR